MHLRGVVTHMISANKPYHHHRMKCIHIYIKYNVTISNNKIKI